MAEEGDWGGGGLDAVMEWVNNVFNFVAEFRGSGCQTARRGISLQEIRCAKLLVDVILLCQAQDLSPFLPVCLLRQKHSPARWKGEEGLQGGGRLGEREGEGM